MYILYKKIHCVQIKIWKATVKNKNKFNSDEI